MTKNTNVKNLCDRELLEKILSIVEEKAKSSENIHPAGSNCLYDNKTLMAKLGIKDKYLKKLRDNGYLGYSREPFSLRGFRFGYCTSGIKQKSYVQYSATDKYAPLRGGAYSTDWTPFGRFP